MLDREGPHMGALVWALRKTTPDRTNLLIFGVKVWGCPLRVSMQSFRSSIMMSNTLGFLFSCFSHPKEHRSKIHNRLFNKCMCLFTPMLNQFLMASVIARAMAVMVSKSLSLINFLFIKLLPTPRQTAPFTIHSAAFSAVIPPVGIMGI